MVDGFRYEPDQVVIKAGESVTFVNESSDVHTVTAYEDSLPEGAEYFGSGDFESEDAARDNLEEGFIKPGEEYEVSLDQPGTYRYFCVPHESSGMRGTIIVED
jgi:plastocyanin